MTQVRVSFRVPHSFMTIIVKLGVGLIICDNVEIILLSVHLPFSIHFS